MSERSLSLLEDLAVAGALSAIEEVYEVQREITQSDIPIVVQELREKNWARANSPGEASDIRVLRVGHHQLAQLLAAGVEDVEASYVTGKSVSTIRSLRGDPAFKELLSYYAEQQHSRDLNIYDRLTTIGALASELLAERLEQTPDKFTNGELRQLLEIAAPSKGNAASGERTPASLAVSINFVPAPTAQDVRLERGKIIEERAVEANEAQGDGK